MAVDTIEVEFDSVNFILGEKFSPRFSPNLRKKSVYMKMGIMFNWFTTTQTLEAAKKTPKRVNKAKKELAYQLFFTPYVLVWRQNVPWSVKYRARDLIRLVPIMLLKLPIMLWRNAPEFCLLCSNYAPYVSQYSPQIQHFLSLILLKSQNHEYQWSSFIYLGKFVFLVSFPTF